LYREFRRLFGHEKRNKIDGKEEPRRAAEKKHNYSLVFLLLFFHGIKTTQKWFFRNCTTQFSKMLHDFEGSKV
jgi:hypothetical protein